MIFFYWRNKGIYQDDVFMLIYTKAHIVGDVLTAFVSREERLMLLCIIKNIRQCILVCLQILQNLCIIVNYTYRDNFSGAEPKLTELDQSREKKP